MSRPSTKAPPPKTSRPPAAPAASKSIKPKPSKPSPAATASTTASKPPAALTLVQGSKNLLADGKTRANVEAMRKAAKILGVKAPSARGAKADQELLGSIRIEIGKRLQKIPSNEGLKCSRCEEISTEDTPDYCPFCGDLGTEDPAANAPIGTVAEAEVEEAEVVELPGIGIAASPVPPAANIEVGNDVLKQALELALERIRQLKKQTVRMSYEIGLLVRDIRDKQLYKAQGFKSFRAFASAPKMLPFARESALQLISIVERYTKDDYDEIGFAKLRVIAAVNDNSTEAKLLTAARDGATTKELQTVARTTQLPAKKLSAPPPEKGDKITLLGKIDARSQVAKLHDAKTKEIVKATGMFKARPADVYGEIEIADNVFLRVGLRVNDSNELTGLTVRFVRSDSEE